MKKAFFGLFALLVFAVAGLGFAGTKYFWAQKIKVKAGTIVDSTYTNLNNRWEEVNIWFVDCYGKIKVGAPDTTDFSSRTWIELSPYQVQKIGSGSRLRRLWFTAKEDSGWIFLVGYKTIPQY